MDQENQINSFLSFEDMSRDDFIDAAERYRLILNYPKTPYKDLALMIHQQIKEEIDHGEESSD